uniref:Dephospho-CoA kinase domain-containing protein n=1 Tax=Strigamia maritima TaxID=126957 RepID=T1JD75_STRMM
MFLVGLTGGIGSGKSTVAKILMDYGIHVVDADLIAREIVEPGKPAWHKIRNEFGDSVFLEDGTLNRAILGEIIFKDSEKRKILNEITHPYIHRRMAWNVVTSFFKGYQFVVLDLPLMYETGTFLDYLHKTIVVFCEENLQTDRIVKRNNYTAEEAERRIRAQLPLEQKCQRADFVIDNNGSLEQTRRQTELVLEILQHSKAHWRARILFFGWITSICAFAGWIFSQIPAKKR